MTFPQKVQAISIPFIQPWGTILHLAQLTISVGFFDPIQRSHQFNRSMDLL